VQHFAGPTSLFLACYATDDEVTIMDGADKGTVAFYRFNQRRHHACGHIFCSNPSPRVRLQGDRAHGSNE
jgi:hypothetical protein